MQIKTPYLFSGIRQRVRYTSAVDDDVGGARLVVSDMHLVNCSGINIALALVSAAKTR